MKKLSELKISCESNEFEEKLFRVKSNAQQIFSKEKNLVEGRNLLNGTHFFEGTSLLEKSNLLEVTNLLERTNLLEETNLLALFYDLWLTPQYSRQ